MWCKWWIFFLSSYNQKVDKRLPSLAFVCQVGPDWSWTSDVWLHHLICLQGNHQVTQSLQRTRKKKQTKHDFHNRVTCVSHISNYHSCYKNEQKQASIERTTEGALIRIKCRIVLLLMRYLDWAWVLWHVSWLGRQSFGRRCRPGPSRSPPGQSRRGVWQLVSAASWPTDCQPGGRSASRRHRSLRRCWSDRRWRRTDASLKSL